MMRSMTVDRPRKVYHLVHAKRWGEVNKMRGPYAPPSFAQDGYIQAADDPAFLRRIAAKNSVKVHGDFVIIEIDTFHPLLASADIVYKRTSFASDLASDDESSAQTLAESKPWETEQPRIFAAVPLEAISAVLAISTTAASGDDKDGSRPVAGKPPPPTAPPPSRESSICCCWGPAKPRSSRASQSIIPAMHNTVHSRAELESESVHSILPPLPEMKGVRLASARFQARSSADGRSSIQSSGSIGNARDSGLYHSMDEDRETMFHSFDGNDP